MSGHCGPGSTPIPAARSVRTTRQRSIVCRTCRRTPALCGSASYRSIRWSRYRRRCRRACCGSPRRPECCYGCAPLADGTRCRRHGAAPRAVATRCELLHVNGALPPMCLHRHGGRTRPGERTKRTHEHHGRSSGNRRCAATTPPRRQRHHFVAPRRGGATRARGGGRRLIGHELHRSVAVARIAAVHAEVRGAAVRRLAGSAAPIHTHVTVVLDRDLLPSGGEVARARIWGAPQRGQRRCVLPHDEQLRLPRPTDARDAPSPLRHVGHFPVRTRSATAVACPSAPGS